MLRGLDAIILTLYNFCIHLWLIPMKFFKATKTAAAAANGYLKAKVQDPWEDRSKMKGAKKDNGWGLVKLLANCKPVLPFSGCRIDSPLKAAAVIS